MAEALIEVDDLSVTFRSEHGASFAPWTG